MFGLTTPAGALSALAVAFVFRKLFWRGGSEPFIMEIAGLQSSRSEERGAETRCCAPRFS